MPLVLLAVWWGGVTWGAGGAITWLLMASFSDERSGCLGPVLLSTVRGACGWSLAALAARLSDKGVILVTVPAFPFLWSRHDERHHHFRRYTRKTLAEVAAKAGLKVRYSSYFNFFLFPAAVATRALKRLTGSETPDDSMPSGWVNGVLTRVFGAERHLVGRLRLPFGLSLAAVLERA